MRRYQHGQAVGYGLLFTNGTEHAAELREHGTEQPAGMQGALYMRDALLLCCSVALSALLLCYHRALGI